MATLNLGPLHRDKANYIFNKNRLLVGCLVRDNQRTEAWFGKALPSVIARAGVGWRLSTTANGSELMTAMSQLHPALQVHCAGGNSKAYFSINMTEQRGFLTGRYNDVVAGRAKYSEREGGELKTMDNVEMLPRHNMGNTPQAQAQTEGQKRKRGAESSVDSANDKKAKLYPDYRHGNDEDDDEELRPYVKIEVDPMNHTPTLPKPTTPDLQQPRPVQSQSDEQISASIAKLGIAEKVVAGDYKPADQKHEVLGAVKPDSMTLTAMVKGLKRHLLNHSDEWMSYACSHGLALMDFAVRLRTAAEVDQILVASRNVLRWLNGYCEHIGTTKLTQQQNLVDARGGGMHGDIVQAHESLVEKYQEKENELRVVFEEMKQRVELLQTGLNIS